MLAANRSRRVVYQTEEGVRLTQDLAEGDGGGTVWYRPKPTHEAYPAGP